jgi:hypothetical protein
MKRILFLLAILAMSSSQAYAVVIVPPGSSWQYQFDSSPGPGFGGVGPDSTAPVDGPLPLLWKTDTSAVSDLAHGPSLAPFGDILKGALTLAFSPDFVPATDWPIDTVSDGDDLFVRKIVDFTGFILASLKFDLGIDNGFKLYVNGVLVASDNKELFTTRWEYTGALPGAVSGLNVIALELEDHDASGPVTNLNAFDMQITGDPIPVVQELPEPGTLLMFGMMAPVAYGWARRRKMLAKK